MKTTILTVCLICSLSVGVYAQAPKPAPCEDVDTDDLLNMGSPGTEVLDVGPVTKLAGGGNKCSVVIDTNKGRIRLTFTTMLSINGEQMIRRVDVRAVPY